MTNNSTGQKKTTIFVVRHGETEYNRRMIVQGRRINSELNATGRRQARALAERFRTDPPDVVYTSTLRRAVQTGAYLSEVHPHIPVYRDVDLEEMSWGVLEGQELSPEVYQILRDVQRRWEGGVFDVCVDGGESILQVQKRAIASIERMVNRHEGRRILVVTHGRFIRVLLASILPGYDLRRMNEIDHTNAAVNLIECNGGAFEASLLNCTAHLEEAEMLSAE